MPFVKSSSSVADDSSDLITTVFTLTTFRLLFCHVLSVHCIGVRLALEDSLRSAKAPGVTKQMKCDNAVTAIRKAKEASAALSKHNIRVFAQGSYCNRTNVREDMGVSLANEARPVYRGRRWLQQDGRKRSLVQNHQRITLQRHLRRLPMKHLTGSNESIVKRPDITAIRMPDLQKCRIFIRGPEG